MPCRTYEDISANSYHRLLDVLHELSHIDTKIDVTVTKLPESITVCTQKQDLKIRIWRGVQRLSALLQDPGARRTMNATGVNRVAASHHYAHLTQYKFTV